MGGKNMRESLEEADTMRSYVSEKPHYVLWSGILSKEVIEFGPSGSFAVNKKLALTVWPADVKRLLEHLEGRNIRIVISEEEIVISKAEQETA